MLEFRMSVVECDVPSGSALSRELIERAYFRDSYRAPLSRTELGIVDIFFGIFAHHPLWMKLLLIVRNKIASLAGLDAPTASEIIHVEMKNRYAVGEEIGVWPIFSLTLVLSHKHRSEVIAEAHRPIRVIRQRDAEPGFFSPSRANDPAFQRCGTGWSGSARARPLPKPSCT
jgi:Protein of unknown function (DUF2867)